LALGNSKPCPDLQTLLSKSDFVSLHVPLSPQTQNMIGENELRAMKQGICLLNASRGNVVVIKDLVQALKSGHLRGAYLDVYPNEPSENGKWETELMDLPNVLLTPHIGGSTEEAQGAIADEVSSRFLDLINKGYTTGSVNFPEIALPVIPKAHRILNIHKNVPGVLRDINKILENYNVMQQSLRTTDNIGYLVIDVDKDVAQQILTAIDSLEVSIRSRILY